MLSSLSRWKQLDWFTSILREQFYRFFHVCSDTREMRPEILMPKVFLLLLTHKDDSRNQEIKCSSWEWLKWCECCLAHLCWSNQHPHSRERKLLQISNNTLKPCESILCYAKNKNIRMIPLPWGDSIFPLSSNLLPSIVWRWWVKMIRSLMWLWCVMMWYVVWSDWSRGMGWFSTDDSYIANTFSSNARANQSYPTAWGKQQEMLTLPLNKDPGGYLPRALNPGESFL